MTARTATATRPQPTLRRRFDSLMLRWQARLDAAWADRFLPWLIALVVAVVYGLIAYARAHSFDAGSDLGRYVQAAWLITHDRGPELSLTGNHLLADHFPIGFYAVAQLTRWLPAAPVLLGLQSVALGLGAIPLWRLARGVGHLRVGTAAVVVVAYAHHPLLHVLNLADFRPDAVAVAPMLATAYFALRGRWRLYALMAALTVVWNADFGLVVAGLGLLLLIEGRPRAGLWSLAGGLGWTALAVLVLEPRFGMAGFVAVGAFSDYGRTGLDILITMVGNPIRVMGDIVAEANFTAAIGVLAPLLFLPLLAPRYLVPALPLQLLYFVADVPTVGGEGAAFILPLLVFSPVATSFALARMGRRTVERVLIDPRLLVAVVVAAVGFFLSTAPSSPYQRPWDWGRRDSADIARETAADLIDDRLAVRASPSIVPLVAERERVYELEPTAQPRPDAAAKGVDAVIADDRATPRWQAEDRVAFTEGMARLGFDLVFRAQAISVYARAGS